MKSKFYKLIGVALTVVLLASLTVGLAGVPAGAASSNLKFVKLELPMVEDWNSETLFADSEGDFWCAPATDTGPIAQTPDGSVIFATVYASVEGLYYVVTEDIVGDDFVVGIDYDDQWGNNDTVTVTIAKDTDAGATGAIALLDADDGCIDVTDITLNTPYPTEGEIKVYSTARHTLMFTIDYNDAASDGGTLPSYFQEVLKSMDGGYSWIPTGFYKEWSTVTLDGTSIVDIVASPDYTEDTSIFVATMACVYQSVDGGKNFILMEDGSTWTGESVVDLDVTLDDRGRLAYMVGTSDGSGGGDVYVLATETGLAWELQGVGAYDVLACSFSPYYSDDEAIFAVVADGAKTRVRTSVAYVGATDPWNGWGANIGDAKIQDALVRDFSADSACIGFPDDFDAFGIGNNVCWVGIDGFDVDTDKAGDVYKVQLGDPSRSTDLDIRGVTTTLVPTATQIYSIDVAGDTADAFIMVGTDYLNRIYRSEDGDSSWKRTGKEPTGAMAQVLMTPDFLTSKVAYATTSGFGSSAFQQSTDGANSWNQISLIDYGFNSSGNPNYAIKSLDTYGYASDGTLYAVTQIDDDVGALWGRLDGKHWERMLCYANGQVTPTLKKIKILGDGSAMFAQDINNRTIWRSTDMGATFPKKITTKPNLYTISFISSTTYYTGHTDGNIYWSTKSGVAWTPPDDSEIPASVTVNSVSVKGDLVIASTSGGQVFISTNGGKTVERVGKSGPFAADASVGKDLGFDSNGILYATTRADQAVMRCEVDLANPGAAEWTRIDSNTGAPAAYDSATLDAGSPPIVLPPSGILYVVDGAAVAANAGGLWRCTEPTITSPYFERTNTGLTATHLIGFAGFTMTPTFFCADKSAAYYDQIVIFTDTLNVGVPLASPEADETGVGLLPEGFVYPAVRLYWEEMAGARGYQYQVALDAKFKTRVADDFTTSLATEDALALDPNTTYYWRVRVAKEGSILGAPLISPWSATYKFKTAIGASMARPALQAPWPGEPDVPLSPTFEWSGIEWAEVYEYELAVDPTTAAGGYFATPLVALVGTDSLVSTAWKCDATLEYTTRYYWHVKAIGVDTDTPWSDVGTFTTMSKAPDLPPPADGITIPPVQEITPAWIWAIVIIGAILVIAVIVLIVTTRRVP